MNLRSCKYCWPTKRRTHFFVHLDYYLNLLQPARSRPKKNRRNQIRQSYFDQIIFGLAHTLGLITFEDKPNKTKIKSKSLIFLNEAQKRGLNLKVANCFGNYTNNFQLNYKGRIYYYQSNPLLILGGSPHLDSKEHVKATLQKNKLPVAPGGLFGTLKEAEHFAEKNGYPLVVKPNSGSLSCHATYPVTSKKQLQEAVRIAKIYQPRFIVEKYISGNLYRATVIGQNTLYLCQKESPNIVGNGHDTIQELLTTKNNDPKRANAQAQNSTLHQIPIDQNLKKYLHHQGLSLSSVIPKHQKISLQDKYTLSSGCDIINCLENAHPDNRQLFLEIAKIFDADLVGIDFICPDLTVSYKNQQCAVLETNSLPAIDMHQNPSNGKSEPVAEKVWDLIMKKLEP